MLSSETFIFIARLSALWNINSPCFGFKVGGTYINQSNLSRQNLQLFSNGAPLRDFQAMTLRTCLWKRADLD